MCLRESKASYSPALTSVLRALPPLRVLLIRLAYILRSIGAFSFGIITDIIGRKWAFNLTCLITSIFGMLLVGSLHRLYQGAPLLTDPGRE